MGAPDYVLIFNIPIDVNLAKCAVNKAVKDEAYEVAPDPVADKLPFFSSSLSKRLQSVLRYTPKPRTSAVVCLDAIRNIYDTYILVVWLFGTMDSKVPLQVPDDSVSIQLTTQVVTKQTCDFRLCNRTSLGIDCLFDVFEGWYRTNVMPNYKNTQSLLERPYAAIVLSLLLYQVGAR